ncbi:MAG: hypothetical protein FJ398_21865 [Verrucomicrobia bacterium]|nr:hypothetical protein [Verrucomicrobiota bacterium]
MRAWRALVLWGITATSLAAQSPSLTHTIPSAVAPGKTTALTLVGDNLAGATEIWTSFRAHTAIVSASDASGSSSRLICDVSVSEDVPRGIGAIRVATTNGISNLLLVSIDDLSTLSKCGTNKTVQGAQLLSLPIAVDGAAEELGFDYYQFDAAAGQRVNVDIVAHRLGSALDPVVRLLDANGRELAYCDDDPGAYADARVTHRFTAAGKCVIEVRDIRYQGGSKHRYRLRVGDFSQVPLRLLPINEPGFRPASLSPLVERAEVEPNDTPATALPISAPVVIAGTFAQNRDRDFYEFEVQKGQRLVFAGRTRSLGSPCDLYLELRKADDSLVAEANVTGADEGAITNRFNEAGTYRLLVEELNRQGGPDFKYRLEIRPHPPGFALSVETDKFEASAGGTFDVKVECARREYDGPITLSVLGGGSGLALSDSVIPAKTNSVQMKLALPPDLPAGRILHFVLVGRAQTGESSYETQATTMPAIRKLFPQMLYPPLELDGLVALGIKPGQKAESTAASAGAQK